MNRIWILFFCCLVLSGCEMSWNQRYQIVPIGGQFVVLDTKTGETWMSNKENEILVSVPYAGQGDQGMQMYFGGYTPEASRDKYDESYWNKVLKIFR